MKTSEKKKERVSFYIDGFNIYHRIRDYHEKTGKNYRWLDYRSFCNSVLRPNQEISDIYFFTATPPDVFSEGTRKRHQQFTEALISRDIKIIKGYFIKAGSYLKYDKKTKIYIKKPTYTEKQTDINIATQIIVDAVEKQYDKCFLFSGDNDFSAALWAVKRVGEGAKGALLTPPYEKRNIERRGIHSLKEAVEGRVVEVKFSDFDGHSLPEKVPAEGGIIEKPPEYDYF